MIKLRPHILAGLALTFLLAASAQAAVIRLKVTAELANIRLKPSISSAIIRQIKEGEMLEATRKEGEFYLVKLDPDEAGRTSGYVHESLVMALDENAPAEKMQRIVERAEPPKPKPIDETPPVRTEPRPPVRIEPPPTETPRTVEKIEPPDSELGRPSIVFSAGAIDASIGDLNNGAQGLADLYAYQLGVAADQPAGPLHIAFQYGGEFIFPVARQFSIFAGVDYYARSSETIISYPQGLSASTLKVTPEFRAIPVKIGFVFYPSEYLFFKVGAAYAFARAAYAYRFDQGGFWQDWAGEATGGAIGFFGSVGLDLRLSRTFSLIIEAAGQSLSVSGLKGSGTFQDSTLSAPVTETGKLYSYDGQPTPVNSFPLVFLRNKTPSEGGVANAREAALDLSGLSLKAGFKITF
jgi:hypothetical protein